jgi:hypothetical protein
MKEIYEAYPLTWPDAYKRTPANKRINSRFDQTMDKAQRFLREEISRLGGRELIVSTNIPVRRDGGLFADWMKRKIEDPGVAIYFKYKDKDISMCCDQYNRVWENIYALGKGIEALRGMERWGVSDFLERAFTGFAALPAPGEIIHANGIWEALGLPVRPDSKDIVEAAYKAKAKQLHPDRHGGSHEAFTHLQQAYKQALSTY